jgi:hypothetical protein
MNQRSFGAGGNEGGGDACGRCFNITAETDPYSPQNTVPHNSVVVKVTDLCPFQQGEDWCGQCEATPLNQFNAPVQ